MSVNLISSVSQSFGTDFASHAAQTYAESVPAVSSLLNAGIPVVLAGFFSYARDHGPEALRGLAAEYMRSGFESKWKTGEWKDSLPGIKTRGAEILSTIFGTRVNEIGGALQQQSGVKGETSNGLLKTIAPVSLGVIAEQLSNCHDSAAVSAWINEHTGDVKQAMTPITPSSGEHAMGSIVVNDAGAVDHESTTAAGAERYADLSIDAPSYQRHSKIVNGLFYVFLAIMTFMIGFYAVNYVLMPKPTDNTDPVNAQSKFIPQSVK